MTGRVRTVLGDVPPEELGRVYCHEPRRSYLTSWGGSPGYAYILQQFVPLLMRLGLSESETRALVVENPSRLLTWA